MARNRSEQGPLSDPEVYEYFRVYCAKVKRAKLLGSHESYPGDPEWLLLSNKRRELWAALPESKKAIVRSIKRPNRQAAFDAA